MITFEKPQEDFVWDIFCTATQCVPHMLCLIKSAKKIAVPRIIFAAANTHK